MQHDYQLTLSIVRIGDGAFGCGFENADPQTLALLQDFATRLNPQVGAEEAANESGFSPQFGAVRQSLEKIVADAADKMCVEFLRMVDEVLFLAARDAGNNVDETRYLEGRDEVRGRAEAISKNVPSLLNKGISTIKSPLTLAEDAEASPVLSELSLVAKDEFEEFLTLSQLVSELEPRLKNSLSELDRGKRRIHYLDDGDDFRADVVAANESARDRTGGVVIDEICVSKSVLPLVPAIESTRYCEIILTVYNNSCI